MAWHHVAPLLPVTLGEATFLDGAANQIQDRAWEATEDGIEPGMNMG